MQSNIKIGLTYTGSQEKHDDYANWLKGTDQFEIIKLSAEENNLHLLKDLHGIILSGGVDVHPENYGSSNCSYPNAPEQFNQARDRFETAVFHAGQQLHLPVLGICRGMQLINCILGGTLTQDLGEAANSIHRHEGLDKKHELTILQESLLSEILFPGAAVTNSAHHQCINKIGNGLRVNAYATDGIIEGVEWEDKKDKPVFLGIQWHPERMYKLNMQDSPLSTQIRQYFLSAVVKKSVC